MFKVIAAVLAVTLCLTDAGVITGGWRDVDTANDQDALDVVSFAQDRINERSNSMFRNKVSSVVRVQKQLVNGINYKVEFQSTVTTCTKYESTLLKDCTAGIKVQDCTATVYESFEGNKQLTDFQCQPYMYIQDSVKRDLVEGVVGDPPTCPGCVSGEMEDPNDSRYMSIYITAFGLAKTNMDIGNINILSVRTQVVAGTKYIMRVQTSEAGEPRICDVEIVVAPWQKPAETLLKFDCKPTTHSVQKRAGGIQKVDNPEVFRDTAIRALAMANSVLDDMKIVEASTQVVSGQKIRLTLEGTQDGKKTQCKLAVWSQVWTGMFQVTEFTCKPMNSVEKRRGGQIQKVDNPEEFRDTAIRALAMTNSVLEDMRIVEASTQVVAGQMIRLTLEGKQDGKKQQCKLAVFSQSWTNTFQVSQFKCVELKSVAVAKRLIGLGMEKKVENPEEFRDTAIRALAMSNAALDDWKIVEATTQTVAGQIIRLTLQGNQDGESTQCKMAIWTQVWTGKFDVFESGCEKMVGGVVKRLAGGQKKVENPEQFRDTAIRALAMTNAVIDDMKIVEASTQVVAGQIIRLTLEGSQDGKKTQCKLVVFSQVWTNTFRVQQFTCEQMSKRAMTSNDGGCSGCVSDPVKDVDTNPTYKRLFAASASQSQYNFADEEVNNAKIISVKTQVVNGYKYIMKVEVRNGGQDQMCDVQVVEAPWMPQPITVLQFDCKPEV